MNHCCACNLGDVNRGQFCTHDGGVVLCPAHQKVKMVRASEVERMINFIQHSPHPKEKEEEVG